jgi:hypothetical protein
MSGSKYDGGKIRFELVPPELVHGTAVILTLGATKYKPRNWEQGISWGRCFGALLGHLWKWWWGQDKDTETGQSHLWHAACELAFLMAYEARGMTQFDDRPKGVEIDTARNTLSPGGREMPAPPAPPGEDEQPIPSRDGGQLVQRSDVRLVGRMEMGSCKVVT